MSANTSFQRSVGRRYFSDESLDSAISRGLKALDSTGNTAPTCRIEKYLLLDLVNIARLYKERGGSELCEALVGAIELLDDCEISHPLKWDNALAKARGEQVSA